jgi:hypothetical protein
MMALSCDIDKPYVMGRWDKCADPAKDDEIAVGMPSATTPPSASSRAWCRSFSDYFATANVNVGPEKIAQHQRTAQRPPHVTARQPKATILALAGRTRWYRSRWCASRLPVPSPASSV